MPDYQIPEHEHYREAIDSVRKRVPVPRAVWDQMQTEERAHAFTVAQVARTQVLQQVLDSIDKAVTTGTAITDFRDEIADKLIDQWGGEIPGRIETIFRTNIQVAYAEGRHAINNAPAVKEARPFWRYDDTDNDRECETCHDCHGTVLPADDPWWDTHHPPLHHQCECTVTALTPEEAADEGLTDEAPEVDVDEGFGNEPSSIGRDWAPDLTDIDPELRRALEAKLDELKGQGQPEPPAESPRKEPEAPVEKPAPVEVPEPEPAIDQDGHAPAVAKALRQHDDAHVAARRENALILSPTGEALVHKGGTKSQVGFTQEEFESFRNRDAIVTHNHPNGTSLSRQDYELAEHANAKEIRAVTRNPVTREAWAYSVHRPDGGWPTVRALRRVWNRAAAEVKIEVVAAIRAGRLSIDRASVEYQHLIWMRVQSKLDVGYRARKLKE